MKMVVYYKQYLEVEIPDTFDSEGQVLAAFESGLLDDLIGDGGYSIDEGGYKFVSLDTEKE